MHHHWVAVCMPDLLSVERRDDHRMLVETGGKQERDSRRTPSVLSIGPTEARAPLVVKGGISELVALLGHVYCTGYLCLPVVRLSCVSRIKNIRRVK
jgi:hypothetical protein